MTEIALRDHSAPATIQGSALVVSEEQAFWNDQQVAALRQMGVERASEGDLGVFFHVCQRTGLDPFARQISMIGRNTKDDRTNQWITKYTIQTGIDGYRLVADRADHRDGTSREYGDMLWFDREGNAYRVWTKSGPPAAASCTLLKSGKPFPGVATYAEYVQTKRDGNPNAMWSRMPSNQLMKCAEALALRRAYPQDLSGVYTDDEMGQADRSEPIRVTAEQTGANRMGAMLARGAGESQGTRDEDAQTSGQPQAMRADTPPESPLLDTTSKLARRMFAALGEAGITDADRLDFCSAAIGRTITTSREMTAADAEAVIAACDALPRDHHPEPDVSANDPALTNGDPA